MHKSGGDTLAWSPDGQRIASGGREIEVWDAFIGKTLTKLAFAKDGARAGVIVWSPDGKFLVARGDVSYSGWGDQGNLYHTEIWETSGRAWRSKRGWELDATSDLSLLLWSPDMSRVAFRGYKFEVFSLRSHIFLTPRLGVPQCNGDAVTWSPDSTHLAWGAGNEIPVWDFSSHEHKAYHLLTYREHRSPIVAVNWSPDGKQITSRSEDSSGHVWDAGSGQTLRRFSGPPDKIKNLVSLGATIKERSAISPDGTLKAVPTSDGIELRTLAHDEVVFVYREHLSDKIAQHWSPEVKALAWSSDGTRIAFARFDGTVYVWQAM